MIFLNNFIYLFLVELCCYTQAFSSCDEWGPRSSCGHALLIAAASTAQTLGHAGFSSCASQALEHRLNSGTRA